MNIEKFKDVVENRHNYVQKWKEEKNGKVCGYLCGNVPEEILYAAKVLPVRIIGSHDPATQSVTHIPDFKCAFCRDCLNQALQGKYEYLDGLAYTTCCISTKMVFSSWHMHVPLEWKYAYAKKKRPFWLICICIFPFKGNMHMHINQNGLFFLAYACSP